MTDTWAEHYATAAGLRHWPCEELVRFGGRLGHALGASVLEVGCGNGANLRYLAQHAKHVVGLDASEAALAHVPKDLPGQCVLRHGDLSSISYPDGSFSLVVDCMTSQHLTWEQHGPAYREYRRVLREGGRLFLYHLDYGTTANPVSETFETGGPYDYASVGLFPTAGLVCLPPAQELVRLVKRSGFGAVELRGLVRTYPDGMRASYAVIAAEAA